MSDTVAASYTFVGDHVSARRTGEEGGGGRRRSELGRLIGSWGLGSSIGDLANTARPYPVLYCAEPFINHSLCIFAATNAAAGGNECRSHLVTRTNLTLMHNRSTIGVKRNTRTMVFLINA